MPERDRNATARQAALTAAERLPVAGTGVVQYQSHGRVLIVGGDEAQWCAARLEPPLHPEILLTEGDPESGVPCTALGGRALSLRGHLGAFEVELGEPGRHNHQVLQADLVIDLSQPALIQRELPPPGYWHFGREPQDLDAAVLVLDGMLGTFEKPRFFAYDPAICAHGRSGQAGCTRCIDSCPADAIISIGEQVEVNPNLCQGGGICASVCPTGAMRYAYPAPGDTAERVRLMLKTYLREGGSEPVVAFVADADAPALPATPSNVLLVVVEELASVGHEIWLAALAWGAHSVLLADGGSMPARSRDALDRQLDFCRALLRGFGYAEEMLRRIDSQGLATLEIPGGTRPPAADFAANHPKRQQAGMAISHLWEHAALRPAAVPLSGDAPYGRIDVATDRCTLCMSCTSVCPAQALSAGDDTPKLVFYEDNCVQCGICANACPESAITLEARYLADPEQRRPSRVLHEEAPFCCVSCGAPFATHRVIDNILDKLTAHPMFQTERARRRLQMCEDCRVVDAVQDDEAMHAGLFSGRTETTRSN